MRLLNLKLITMSLSENQIKDLNALFKCRAKKHARKASFFLIIIFLLLVGLLFFSVRVYSQTRSAKDSLKNLYDSIQTLRKELQPKVTAKDLMDSNEILDGSPDSNRLLFRAANDSIIVAIHPYNDSTLKVQITDRRTEKIISTIYKNVQNGSTWGYIPKVNEPSKINDTLKLVLIGLGILIFSFLAMMMFQLHKYHSRLSQYYNARADALLFLPGIKFEEALKKLSPDTYHIGNLKYSHDHLVELLALIKESDKATHIYCGCCKCCCEEKKKKETDENTAKDKVDDKLND